MARDRDLPPDLVAELESQSRYTADSQGRHPLILRHRVATLRSGTYHILSRIQESGTDYSKRNNHLAHHLAFRAEDAAGLPNPAAILLNWRGWRDKWIEPPRTLEPFEAFQLQDLDSFWATPQIPQKFESTQLAKNLYSYVFEVSLQEERLLIEYLRRTINDLPANQRWTHTFTSCLLPTDRPQDFVWSGKLAELPLPYELDTTPRPLHPPQAEAPQASTPSLADLPQPEAQAPTPAPTPNAALLKKAPRVEIPAEYDKRRRKRPKRPFGQREFKRAINIAIVGGALICIALLFFFIQSHKSSSIVQSQSDSEQRAAQSLQARQDVWQRFANAGYPRAQLESARATAAFLAKAGEDAPSQIIEFLDALIAADPSKLSTGLRVPKYLLHTENSATTLPLSPISYPHINQLALLPASLLEKWKLEADPLSAVSPLSALPNARFSPQALADALDAYHLQADTVFQNLPTASLQALESYFTQKQELLENAQFAPILEIHEAFGLGPEHAFIGFDEQNLLIPGSPMTLARHLNELLATLLEQSKDLALQSSAFRQALTVAATQRNALEVATTIHQAFATLDLSSRPSTDPLLRIRTLWEAAFVRSDLMEQTILGYTLEALEAAKLTLTQTRSQFSQRELTLYQQSQTRAQQIESLKQAAAPANSSKEWIVISKQSPKLPRSQP